jgi:lysophospholipase L1-like esterase
MSRASRARKIATAAAVGGGGVGLAVLGGFGVLSAEARIARRTVGDPVGEPPAAAGWYGVRRSSAEPFHLALLGDSSAAGLGVRTATDTPGALLAHGLAAASGRPVCLRVQAVVGATSGALAAQVDAVLDGTMPRPHVAVIMVGANDVTHRVRVAAAVGALSAEVVRLRAAGVDVIVCTCPDLGTIEPIAQPLRYVARRWSRQLAAAQTIACVEAGARTVSLGDLLGPEFAARPGEMFSADQFHPSAAGYASAAAAILPSVLSVLGFGEQGEPQRPRRADAVLPVERAAVRAADRAGSEVSADGDGAAARRGWAFLRLRRRGVETTEPSSASDPVGTVR